MINQKTRLGKGLDALYNRNVSGTSGKIIEVPLLKIVSNPFQPRKIFSEDEIKELANSIEQKGLIQPIALRKVDTDKYEIVSGERRYRAFKRLGKETIPAKIMENLSDTDMLELAIIENIQREDLNPIEISNSYNKLMEDCNLTQEQVAERLGVKRSSVANLVRIKNLPEIIKSALSKNQISLGHAKVILGLSEKEHMIALYDKIISEDLSVRKTEEYAKSISQMLNILPVEEKVEKENNPVIGDIEKRVAELLSVKEKLVRIKVGKKNNGTLNIKFKNLEELDRIIKVIGAE